MRDDIERSDCERMRLESSERGGRHADKERNVTIGSVIAACPRRAVRGLRFYEQMKLRSSARILKAKSISSIRTCISAFNSLEDGGRATAVLLHGQHAFEMLLKAALNQKNIKLFDPETGRSISFEGAIRQAQQIEPIKLTESESGTLRAIDAMRDDEQHWYNTVDEGILYLHIRAAITLFDDLLARVFDDRLAHHLPLRVLPVSLEPPQDFQILVDREYSKISAMLQPGRRAGAEARARIRTLLAMEAHEEPDTRVSDTDVNRVEKGIRAGKSRGQVFPKLSVLGASIDGAGPEVQVRFVKSGGLAVSFVGDGEGVDAAAVRSIDLSKKYHWSPARLAEKLVLTEPRALAVRRHLGVDHNENMSHKFSFGSSHFVRYSDNALVAMNAAVDELDMSEIWRAHRPVRATNVSPTCSQQGCMIVADALPIG